MSWFKRKKDQTEIPPVAQAPTPSSNTYGSSTNAPSYRSNASTYVASRDGDLSDPRAWGKDHNAYKPDQSYGQGQGGYGSNAGVGSYGRHVDYSRNDSDSGYGGSGSGSGDGRYSEQRPNKLRKDSGYGSEETRNDGPPPGQGGGYGATTTRWDGPRESPFNRNAGREALDPYSRGERNLDADRNALFSGVPKPQEGAPVPNRYGGSAGYGEYRPLDNPDEATEDDMEALKTDIRNMRLDSRNTASRALEIARQAEQTGMSTLTKLGQQSEKLADTERHLDVAKGQMYRADDNADEIKKLGRSIFIPAITLNKEKKRLEQERRREMRFQEELDDRELAMQDIRETQNRIGRIQSYGQSGDDSEGIGRQMTSGERRLREAERKRYLTDDATAEEEAEEDEIYNYVDRLGDVAKNLKGISLAMGSELEMQNKRLDRIGDKTDKLGFRVAVGTEKLKRLQN